MTGDRGYQSAKGQQCEVVERDGDLPTEIWKQPIIDPSGLQKMAARRPKLAKRPKFLMSDPDGSRESLRNFSALSGARKQSPDCGASLGIGPFSAS
mgnify:CR=1 FL=1